MTTRLQIFYQVISLMFWERGGYVQAVIQLNEVISLQNVLEKIMNDINTLFLFNILKILCSYFCTFILFSYNVCIELFGESHLGTTVYKFT